MKTATVIIPDMKWRADAKLYQLNPPYQTYEYVIVSAVVAPDTGLPETLVFPSNFRGETNMHDIFGRRGTLSHFDVLKEMGYSVVNPN